MREDQKHISWTNKKKIMVCTAGALVVFVGLWTLTGMIGGSGKPLGLEDKDPVTKSQAVAAAADGNWGLSFQTEGAPPIGNATSEYLKQFNAFYIGDSKANDKEEKCIYLTFDAGYENGYTAKILDVLKEEKVPAAFFLVGNYISENKDLVKRMNEEGHIV